MNEAQPETIEPAATPTSDESPTKPQLLLAPEDYPDVSHLITEDGAPVDNMYVEKQYRLLTDPLVSSWSGPGEGRPFVTATNVGLFFVPRNPAICPDFLLSLDVEYPKNVRVKEGHSYFVWLYGKVPDVVGEIVSDRRGGEDTFKLGQYARGRVPYYFIYDPDNWLKAGVLRVFGLHPDGYVPITEHWLNGVGLGLTLWSGTYANIEERWLRWCDRDGRLIPTGLERAEQERQRNQELAERISRLEAQLRGSGVEPSA